MGNQYKEGKSDEEIKYIERVESTDMFYTKTKPLYLLGNLEMRFFVTHKNRSYISCLLYTSPSPRDATLSRMPSSA